MFDKISEKTEQLQANIGSYEKTMKEKESTIEKLIHENQKLKN